MKGDEESKMTNEIIDSHDIVKSVNEEIVVKSIVEEDDLNEARRDSGIDYDDDEVAANDNDEDDDNEDANISVKEVLSDGEKERKEILRREEEEEENVQRNKQLQSLEQLRADTEENEEWRKSSIKDRRMEFLMAQSDVFTSFLMGGNSSIGKKMTNKKTTGPTSPNRRGGKKDDSADNAAMLAMEESRFTRLTKQPDNIKFGTMRPFQVEGLNWMIRLHDCNINGILADEMGKDFVNLKCCC